MSGVQVVQVEGRKYRLDEEKLRKILMGNIKSLPVVVVSVAGAFRGGKSFVLNFFLKFLTASRESQLDGSWLGNDEIPLGGFSWRGGTKRNTTGIVMWSEPIITTLATGEKVAIILMDTQGTFDSSSTVKDCSTIFALSTLLSSVQIYNLSHNIREDDLQHLQLFTEYGKLLKNENEKAFQALEFLVRDWQNAAEFAYGSSGGNLFLAEKLQTSPNMARELQDLRYHIRDSFKSVSCFLMPHPGMEVVEPDFDGRNSALSSRFKVYIKELVIHLFGPGRLKPKEINGQAVKAGELFTYFQAYMKVFNSDEIPSPKSIMEATAEAGLSSAFEEARNMYENAMEQDCGSSQPSLPAHDLKELHDWHSTKALETFSSKKKLGSKSEIKKYKQKLKEEFDKRLPQYADLNIGKSQKIVTQAKEMYEETIKKISGDGILCVHPQDLETVHKQAFRTALQYYDKNRKCISKNEDKERQAFIKTFEKQYQLLFLTNEQNNKNAVTEQRLLYWQTMERKCSEEVPLSESEFLKEHKAALDQALENFSKMRNHPDTYENDKFKADLIKTICTYFDQMKSINKSKNKVALHAAVKAYDDYMTSAWDHNNECLHPDELENEQKKAERQALKAFRPNKVTLREVCFDTTDEDEKTLSEIIYNRYSEIKSNNDSTNEMAVQAALNKYNSEMEYNTGFSYWWLLVIPFLVTWANSDDCHKECKSKAVDIFYERRRDGNDGCGSTDRFFNKLESEIATARKKYI